MNELTLPDTAALSAEGSALVERARAFRVTKADDYAVAAREDKLLVALIRTVDETFDPIVTSAKANYDTAREKRDLHRVPLLNGRALYKARMAEWEVEQDRIRREKELKLQERADAEERER